MATINIYTDGSYQSKRGRSRGGWGFSVSVGGTCVAANSGNIIGPKSNIHCELLAILEGLEWYRHSRYFGKNEPAIHSDSMTVITSLTNDSYLESRRINNIEGHDVDRLFEMYSRLKPDLNWVRAHNGDVYNQLADTLAKTAMQSHPLKYSK